MAIRSEMILDGETPVAPFAQRILAVTLCGLAAPVVLTPTLFGQAAHVGDPYANTTAVVPSNYWGYSYSPYGAFLHGAADVIRAQGEFLIKNEQVPLIREDVRRAKLVTHRLELEHWEWTREWRYSYLKRERERQRQEAVDRSLNDPAPTAIMDGYTLNYLLNELERRPELPSAGSTPVEESWLKDIQYNAVDGHGTMGLLKNEKLFWPQLCLRPEFSESRARIEQLLKAAREHVATSPTRTGMEEHAEVLRDLRRAVLDWGRELRAKMSARADDPDWSPAHCIDAKRFLRQLEDTVNALERPDAGFYLSPLQGKNVAELVRHMKKNGLRFADATRGCERSYIALHHALADELRRVQPPSPAKETPAPKEEQ